MRQIILRRGAPAHGVQPGALAATALGLALGLAFLRRRASIAYLLPGHRPGCRR